MSSYFYLNSKDIKTYSATRILNGFQELTDHSITVENGKVSSIFPIDEKQNAEFHSHFIIPAFTDIQIYGARQKLFSMFPSVDTLDKMNLHCRESGTFQFMPTVATNSKEVVLRCIDAVRAYWKKGLNGVIGLHLEGPWINPVKRGAHILSLIHSPTTDEVNELLQYGKDVIKMITLAPEITTPEIISLIQSHKIIVSAGHSNASFKEAMNFFENGIRCVTHLFNAMSSLHHRDTGLPGAVFKNENVMASIIADGIHVDYNAINIAKKLLGNRLYLITDAVTDTSEGPYKHQLEVDKYVADGVLSGSSLTMLQSIKNSNKYVEIDIAECCRMASLYPAQLLNMRGGTIELGDEAVFLMLNEQFELERIIS